VSARAWAAFASVSILWGIPYLFIKVAVDDGISPWFLAWFRVTLAALVLLGLAWRSGVLGSVRGHGRMLLLYAVIEICIPFPLIAGGEQRIPSSLTAILIAAVPLIIALLALRFDASERVRGSRLWGLVIGFAGVVALVGLDVSGSSAALVGSGMILLAAVGYAAGPMVLRNKLGDLDPRALMGVALGIAAVILTPAAALNPPGELPSANTFAALIVLGLLCTATAFVLFASLITEVGAGRAAVITYVAPVVAVGLGVAVLDERPGAGAIAGLLLIIAGSWLSTGGRLPPGVAAFAAARRRPAVSPEPKDEPTWNSNRSRRKLPTAS
jgi:drug/metabolite transporter (DMT)-like permease